METNLQFIHRGVIQPQSGIGAHFHNQCEEMFVIFDGEAQFTIDGRTSVLKGPAGAPCRMGHMHAIYNATDKPVQWMNINVTAVKNSYDAFNFNDGRVDAPLDAIRSSCRCASTARCCGRIPIQIGELHSFENKGTEPLEFLIIGVSRDSNRRVDSVDTRDLGGRRGN